MDNDSFGCCAKKKTCDPKRAKTKRYVKKIKENVEDPVDKWDDVVCKRCGMPGSRILHEDISKKRSYKCNCGHIVSLNKYPWDDEIDCVVNSVLFPVDDTIN